MRPITNEDENTLSVLIDFDCEISCALSFYSVLCLMLKNKAIEMFFQEYIVCLNKKSKCFCSCKYHIDDRPEKAFFYKKPYKKEKFDISCLFKKEEPENVFSEIIKGAQLSFSLPFIIQ